MTDPGPMPIDWEDYMWKTLDFTAEMHGAYLMLIGHYWMSQKPLPNDDDLLWWLAECPSLEEWQRIKPLIWPFFMVTPDGLVPDLVEEWRRAAEGGQIATH